jgi:hypothetical protein
MFEWQLTFAHPLQSLQGIVKACGDSDHIFHVHGSFGDVYLQIAVIKETLSSAESTAVIIDKRYAQLANNSIGQQAKIILADGNQVNHLLSQLKILGHNKGIPTRLLPTLYPMIAECMSSGYLPMVDFLRVAAGSESIGALPAIETNSYSLQESKQLLEQAGLPIGKTAIICADNNTEIEFEDEFWIKVIEWITDRGWVACLNSAGTLNSDKPRRLVSLGLPNLNIPPHLPVSIATVAGTYFVGNNGFATIQALFNRSAIGFHLFRGDLKKNGFITAKHGKRSKASLHSESFANQFLNIQKEFEVIDSDSLPNLKSEIDLVLS